MNSSLNFAPARFNFDPEHQPAESSLEAEGDFDLAQFLETPDTASDWADEAAGLEDESSYLSLPRSVLAMLKGGLAAAAVKLAIRYGQRDENQLTNMVFFARHPERNGRSLSATEPNFQQLSREWLDIRDRIVRPALRGSSTAPSSGRTPSASPASPSGAPDIVSVRGIRVARSIAPQIERLLAAAEADGVRLSGGGYRSTASQIELRKKHCGTTHYDIYEKPSSQCTPPTAPPGRSLHEKGLAIDFTYNGASIKDRANPGFVWLSRNAATFGLKNLPSEPWHWSTTGG